MTTEEFIRDCAARKLSRRATQLALGVSRERFKLMLEYMEPQPWVHKGYSVDAVRQAESRRGVYTPHLCTANAKAVTARRVQCLYTLPDGRTGSLQELTALVGGSVAPCSVRRRLKQGWTLLDALSKPRTRSTEQLKTHQRSGWL